MMLWGTLVAIAAVMSIIRIADFDDESPLLWGLVVVGLTLLLTMTQLPFMLDVFLAWVATLVAMMGWKVAQSLRA